MSREGFTKGMAAGAAPFEEKYNQLADATERVGAQVNARLDDISDVQKVILDDLSSREKKELYDLNTLVDIKELEPTEKEFLMAVLYTLSNMTEEVTSEQQAYIRSVKRYLEIKSVQTEVDLSCIENIDSKREERAILQTVMEFLFLEHCDHSYWDEYEDVLDYFSVKNSEIRRIEASIDAIYKATGAQGLAEKFGYVAEGTSQFEFDSRSIVEKIKRHLESDESLFFSVLCIDGDKAYYGDSIHSEYEAERRASSMISSFCSQANNFLNAYSSDSLSDDATQKLLNLVKNDFIEIKNRLSSLDSDVSQRNSVIINEVLNLIDINTVKRKIESFAKKELEDSYYRVSDASSYTYLVNYSSFDHDPPGLFGKKDWMFDCSAAWLNISEEVAKMIEMYAGIVSKDFRREIIRPVVDLIERIK